MKWLLVLLVLPFLLAGGALVSNRPPLFEPPGPIARLKLYLTTHVAQTRTDHVQAELRPLLLEGTELAARAQVMRAMQQLQWADIHEDDGMLRALVTTRWMRFKDDVEVVLEQVENSVLVQVRSTSRVGRGDFAANTRHILDLFETLSMAPSPE